MSGPTAQPAAPAGGASRDDDDEWLWSVLLELSRYAARPSSEAPLRAGRSGGQVWVEAEPTDRPGAVLRCSQQGAIEPLVPLSAQAARMLELYAPACVPSKDWVVAHLGQSLDGRIAPPDGSPEAITGPLDHLHNHRLRALADVVLVGAGTVWHDDPQLNVRLCAGPDPVCAVLDARGSLAAHYRVFARSRPATLVLVAAGTHSGGRHGNALRLPVEGELEPQAALRALRQRALRRVFIEGGGVTVSRFLEADCLTRLQITVSPLVLGRGKPGLELTRVLRLRLAARRFDLGSDVLFDCDLTRGAEPENESRSATAGAQ